MDLETLISDLRNLAAQYEALDSRNEYDRGFHLGAATLATACADKLSATLRGESYSLPVRSPPCPQKTG